MIFNNPLKACFSIKKCLSTIQKRATLNFFFIEKPVLADFKRLLVYKINYQSLFVKI